MIDPLTKVFDQRYFVEYSQKELQRIQQYYYPLSLLTITFDTSQHFECDCSAKETMIKSLARSILESIRRDDCFAYLDNNKEFVTLLPFANTAAAISVAQRLCRKISELAFINQEHLIKPTISIGIASYQENDDSIDIVLQRANEALAEAQKKGQNHFTVHPLDKKSWLTNCS